MMGYGYGSMMGGAWGSGVGLVWWLFSLLAIVLMVLGIIALWKYINKN